MANCCVCLDDTAQLALFSCNDCCICSKCSQELIRTSESKIFCNCLNKVPIVALNTAIASVTELSPDQINNFHSTLNKARKDLTKQQHNLTIHLDSIIKTDSQASSRIRARLTTWLTYLTEALVVQRTAELTQQLRDVNHSLVKSGQMVLETLENFITIHDNLSRRLAECSQTGQWLVLYQTYQSFRSQVGQAIQAARQISLQRYDVVVYRELSPVDLNRAGQVVPVYCKQTGTGYLITGADYCGVNNGDAVADMSISCYLNHQKHGRWQKASPKTCLEDKYYHHNLLIKVITLRYRRSRPSYWTLFELDNCWSGHTPDDLGSSYVTRSKSTCGLINEWGNERGSYRPPRYVINGQESTSVYWSGRGLEVIS